MFVYPAARFAEECLRADEGPFLAGLTISQTISLVIFAGGLVFGAWLVRQPAGRYADRVAPRPHVVKATAPSVTV